MRGSRRRKEWGVPGKKGSYVKKGEMPKLDFDRRAIREFWKRKQGLCKRWSWRRGVVWVKCLSIQWEGILVVIGFTIFFYTEGWGSDWKYYGTNEEGSYFYETESKIHLPKDIVRVCVQSIYTEKGKSLWAREGGKGFQNLEFSLVLSEYNCIERSIRHLRIVFYSKNQEIFYPVHNHEWQLFIPDAMSEVLFKELCE